ncbi:MAG TPA: PHP-associated domain-containing protein [Patescibacteria group bacterium]|nr:PHP-associated domain-containing protein [Patescibacteria group bacterium]
MVRVDLHTHSIASPDGSLSEANYRALLMSERLHVIAVTDHNRIDFAQQLQAELGDSIIVGEEITALEGEIIGLYLQEAIPAGLSSIETVRRILAQRGIVYVPHPFETVRKGLPLAVLDEIADHVDVLETYNGRSIQDRSARATAWAAKHDIAGAASSDAHGIRGWGNTYSILAEAPSRDTLVDLLGHATYSTRSTGPIGRLYPKLNRIRKAA